MRREFPRAVGRSFRTCGVGVDLASRGRPREQICCFWVRAIVVVLLRRRESCRASESVFVMAKDYSIYVLLRCWANISDQRGARGEPGDNRRQAIYMHVPVHVRRTCGVEINIERGDCDKAICDRNSANSPRSPAVLRERSAALSGSS